LSIVTSMHLEDYISKIVQFVIFYIIFWNEPFWYLNHTEWVFFYVTKSSFKLLFKWFFF